MWKNCGLFFEGEIPQRGFRNDPSVTTAQVAESLDQIWIGGKFNYPGGCDPTYSWEFAVEATKGMWNPQVDNGHPFLAGYKYMIYTCIYDDELKMLNTAHVKTH
jgi:hypothetical protein